MKKVLISSVVLMVSAAVLCAGCARMPSDYVPNKVFHYDDSQDIRRVVTVISSDKELTGDRNSSAGVIVSSDEPALQQMQKNISATMDEQALIDDANADEGQQEQYSGTSGEHEIEQTDNADTMLDDPQAQIKSMQEQDNALSDNDEFGDVVADHSENRQDPQTDTGDRLLEYPDENGEQTTVENNDDPKQEDNSNTEGSPDEPGEGVKEVPEQIFLDPNKVVELIWEGELGTYIWGEDVDLSGLTVTAVYEDGHSEITDDYYINMNYPERWVPSQPNTYDTLGVKHKIDTYEPGTYYAEIGKDGVTADVPYELIIMYVNLFIDHRLECLNPDEHNTESDEYGHLRCHYDECLLPDANGDHCLLGEGEMLRLPLYYDYVFTEDDAYSDIYLSEYFDLGKYIFVDFPAAADKYNASNEWGGGIYSSNAYVRLVAYDYREFRGDSPCRYGPEKTAESD